MVRELTAYQTSYERKTSGIPAGFLYPNDRNVEAVSSAPAAGNHFASHHMLAPAEGNTRLLGQRNLSTPHAMLIVGLSVSACSRIPCPPHKLLFRTPLYLPQVRGYGGFAPMFTKPLTFAPRSPGPSALIQPFLFLQKFLDLNLTLSARIILEKRISA